MSITRKHILYFVLVLAWVFGITESALADDYDIARGNRLVILVGPTPNTSSDAPTQTAMTNYIASVDAAANCAWTGTGTGCSTPAMQTADGRTELWSDLPLPNPTNSQVNQELLGPNMNSTYLRLRQMALAYATPTSALNGKSSLLTAILSGLDWMNSNVYSSTTNSTDSTATPPTAARPYILTYENWWDFDIGVPLSLNDILVLIYSGLSTAQQNTTIVPLYVAAIKHFTPKPIGSGANLMWTSEVVSLAGILMKDSTMVATGLSKAPTTLMAQTTTGTNGANVDGFWQDGSFIQHTLPYTGAYGISSISDMVDFARMFLNTAWALDLTTVNRIAEVLLTSFKPVIYKGEMPDDLRGRVISRAPDTSHTDGRTVAGVFLHASTFTSAADALALQSTAKYWLQKDTTFASPYTNFDARTILEASNVLTNTGLAPMADPVGFNLFPSMDRLIHLRPTWAASVSMYSQRVFNYEGTNTGTATGDIENGNGWHTADGMLYIYDADLMQHSNNFWPTVNSLNLEGTTVAMNSKPAQKQLNGNSFVGGVQSLDGKYGAAMMNFAPSSIALTAKKSWFFLDNSIFCLGTGITSSASTNIETVVTNRMLTASGGTNLVTTGMVGSTTSSSGSPVAAPAPLYGSANTQYLHIAGNVTGSNIGYYFPQPTTLKVSREARTGKWTDINNQPAYLQYNASYTRNYYTAYIDHGAQPTAASYAYAVLPAISLGDLQSYAASPTVSVLQNDTSIQAIQDSNLDQSVATSAVFWSASTLGSGGASITSSAPAAVFLMDTGNSLQLGISDPTQANTGTITVSLGRNAINLVSKSAGVTVNSYVPLEVSVNAAGLLGQTATVEVTRNIVIDDANGNNIGGSTASSTGAWTSSTTTPGYYGSDYMSDGNSGKGSKTFTFTPQVNIPGAYQVQVFYNAVASHANNVPVQINYGGGTTPKTLDETTGGGWTSLGTYNFNAGTSGNIVISNTGTTGYVTADAVKLVPMM